MIQIPHNFEPYPYQKQILENDARFKVVVLHRRSGKSKTALNEMLRRAVGKPGVYCYVFPHYNQVKKAIWLDPDMLSHHLPNEIVIKKNEAEMYIKIQAIGGESLIYFLGADKPENVLGMRFDGVVLDEYAQMKEDFWIRIIRPIIGKSGGWVMFVFTPEGKNHAWKLLQQAKEKSDWAWWVLGINDTRDDQGRPLFPVQEIEAIKRDTPEAMFDQEYNVAFIDNATSAFRKAKELMIDPERCKTGLFGTKDDPHQLGVDLAKYQDWTVVAGCNLEKSHIRIIDRCQLVGWTEQKARIHNHVKAHNTRNIVMDSTGVGDPIVDDLKLLGLRITPFKFTESTRDLLLRNLAVKIENAIITFEYDKGLLEEFEAMRYELEGRRVVVRAPSGIHDDRVMAVALSVWEMEKVPRSDQRNTVYTIGKKPYLNL